MNFVKRAKDNSFILNGRSSADWDIVCSSDTTYDAPARDVAAIKVPGRNGELHIDNGRWQNVDLTYNDCVIESDFGDKFDDFRAYCARHRGYQRLEDTFHPDEYRLADMTQGIKVKKLGTRYNAGWFDLTFNCKPQRFLKSGEEPICFLPWGKVSTTDPYEFDWNGRASGIIDTTGTGMSITFTKKSVDAEDIGFYVFCDNGDPGFFEHSIGTISASETKNITFDTGTQFFFLGFHTTTLDGVEDWDIEMTFDNYAGESLTGKFGDYIEITNPTGFMTYPLIKVRNHYFVSIHGMDFYYENKNGGFVKKYSLEGDVVHGHGGDVWIDCENQYSYYIEADSSSESGVKYVNYTFGNYDYDSDSWTQGTFPFLSETTARIVEDPYCSPYGDPYTYLNDIVSEGDSYILIYPRWYTI